jgi:hypothetical protein
MRNGNKTNNGVHEIGTEETRLAYQNDTPGQKVEKYLSQIAQVNEEGRVQARKHFSQVFVNPLEGFPYNEEIEVTELGEDYQKVIKMYPRDNDWKKLITKHKKAIDDFRKNNKDLPSKVEDELIGWAINHAALVNQDAEEFILSILDESTIDENALTDILIDIQQGSTAVELARDHKIPLSAAKSFLKDYYSQKKGNRKEEVEIDENYRELAKHGMGAETKNSIKVGTEVDYYQKDGAKYMGKITKMTPKGYIVRDDKTKKDHEFTYHDRNAAKELLKQGDNLGEGSMDGMKLTGQEISTYFRKNPIRDKDLKKAVEIALDHSGAMNYAIAQIEKLKKGLSKKTEVKKALQFANEEVKYKLNVGVVFTEDTHPCKGLSEDDPCWKDYKQVGMKKKNGKEVPNCVPKESVMDAEPLKGKYPFQKKFSVESTFREMFNEINK